MKKTLNRLYKKAEREDGLPYFFAKIDVCEKIKEAR